MITVSLGDLPWVLRLSITTAHHAAAKQVPTCSGGLSCLVDSSLHQRVDFGQLPLEPLKPTWAHFGLQSCTHLQKDNRASSAGPTQRQVGEALASCCGRRCCTATLAIPAGLP